MSGTIEHIDLYYPMCLIREAEKGIQAHYHEDEMRTPMHMSMGAEAIAVGVCAALTPGDQVLTSYRSHAVYLAKTDDVAGFFLEMYGKVGGPGNGRNGSMHLCNPAKGHMGSSAVVANHIPMALGLAYANKVRKNGNVVAVFFGDGAIDSGTFWESLNIACLWALPVLFVCEDNHLAVETHHDQRWGFVRSLLDTVGQFKCTYRRLIGREVSNVKSIKSTTRGALSLVARNAPVFLQIEYQRRLEHVGVGPSPTADEPSFPDPLKCLEDTIPRDVALDIEQKARERVEAAIAAAKKAPYPGEPELYCGVYHEPG